MIAYPHSPDMPRSHLPFSPCVKVDKLVFVSGQASVDATGAIVPGTFEEEMRRAIANLEKVLRTAGTNLSGVIQTRNYVRDAEDLAAFNRLYLEFFHAPFPARTTITNCLPPALRYEIECIAVAPA